MYAGDDPVNATDPSGNFSVEETVFGTSAPQVFYQKEVSFSLSIQVGGELGFILGETQFFPSDLLVTVNGVAYTPFDIVGLNVFNPLFQVPALTCNTLQVTVTQISAGQFPHAFFLYFGIQ